MNLERIAVMRAQEQIEAGAWKRRDRDEKAVEAVPVPCAICGGEIGNRRGGALMCHACRDAGWAVTPCKACGGKLRALDLRHRRPARRGYCQSCRAEMPQVNKGAETLVVARRSRWRPQPKATPEEIARSLAKLAAKGITVDNTQEAA